MKNIVGQLFSIKMMALGLITFLVSIGIATFIEATYDVQAAKLMVFNSLWFGLLLFYLTINLIVNIFRYKMWRREKVAMFAFHLSFVIILIGSGVTRFYSFEGSMPIREGEQENFIYSTDPYLWYKVNDGKMQYVNDHHMYMSEVTNNDFNYSIKFPEHKTPINISYVNYRKNIVDSLITNDTISSTALEIVTDGMTSNYLSEGKFLMVGDIAISYEKKDELPGVSLKKEGRKIMMNSAFDLSYLPMSQMVEARRSGLEPHDSLFVNVKAGETVPFQVKTLYIIDGKQIVFKELHSNSTMAQIKSDNKKAGKTLLTVKVTDGEDEMEYELEGGIRMIPNHHVFEFKGLVYEMEYGSKKIELPFYIGCKDFRLERYPGSSAPSSFESDLIINDETNGVYKEKTVFMNNVMDYEGYRFFQSSYNPDEKGTILSVNHDWWGTNITYVGYLLMAIGMILSLFARSGRFRELGKLLKGVYEKKQNLISILVLTLSFSGISIAQGEVHDEHDGHDHSGHNHKAQRPVLPEFRDEHYVINEEHSQNLAKLLVQEYGGRIVPMHTVADQVLTKLYRGNKIKEGDKKLNAVQVVLSLHMYPQYWIYQPTIYVSSKGGLRDVLKLEGSHASFSDLTDERGDFIFLEEYSVAHRMLESERGEYEKQLIKLADKYQVFQQVIGWEYMKIIPLKNSQNNDWLNPLERIVLENDSLSWSHYIAYFSAVNDAPKNNDYSAANKALEIIKKHQRKVSSKIVPSESVVAKEIGYNKMHIFKSSYIGYVVFGFILLIVYFIRIFTPITKKSEKVYKWIGRVLSGLLAIMFLYHGYGLYLRWIISGHAPWSNGYEALIFIAWVGMLFGFILSRKNLMILAAAAILAALIIIVTEMNLLEPQITPLVPVLKSFWLKIHVAIITGSYAPLGIGCMLAMLNLILYIFRNPKNGKVLTLNINELTYVTEIAITIGLFMLTIGTFLGGIWANESWGRYWGWDPKETWALVSVLVYAVILHLRYIPALKSKFIFNVVSFWGFTSILFTFFGVNFILTGLHSYAQGDEMAALPTNIWIIALVFFILTVIAAIRNKKYKQSLKENL